ncbi:hypothetical protein N9937_00110 [bacterium]|nr:hypothetical protein [bacterium]
METITLEVDTDTLERLLHALDKEANYCGDAMTKWDKAGSIATFGSIREQQCMERGFRWDELQDKVYALKKQVKAIYEGEGS